MMGFRLSRSQVSTSARSSSPQEKVRADFPGGTERWFVGARGYDMVIVNGVPVMEQGKHTGALPGEVLRGA